MPKALKPILDAALDMSRKARMERAREMGLEADRLFAIHNTTPEGIRAAERLGGIPAPSTAVVPAGSTFDSFGDLSLVARRNVVDPEAGAKLFSGDAYSPRQPRPTYRVRQRDADALWNDLRSAYVDAEDMNRHEMLDQIIAGDPSRFRTNSEGLKLAALRARGEDLPVPRRPVKPPYEWMDDELVREVADAPMPQQIAESVERALRRYEKMLRDELPGGGAAWQREVDDIVERARNQVSAATKEDGTLGPGIEQRVVMGARRMRDTPDAGDVDRTALRNALDERVTDEEAAQFLNERFFAVADRPYFDASGPNAMRERRVPYTLDNLAQHMTGRTRGQEDTMTESLAKARARGSRQFDDIESARRYADQNVMQGEPVRALYDSLQEEASTLAQSMTYQYADGWERLNDMSRAVGDMLTRGASPASARRALRARGFSPSDSDVESVVDLVRRVKQAPVEYMEAKPQRAVTLDEFGGALVRSDTPDDVVEMLRRQGLQVETYNPADEGDRLRAMGRLRDHAFSIGALGAGAGMLAAPQQSEANVAGGPNTASVMFGAAPGMMAAAGAAGAGAEFARRRSEKRSPYRDMRDNMARFLMETGEPTSITALPDNWMTRVGQYITESRPSEQGAAQRALTRTGQLQALGEWLTKTGQGDRTTALENAAAGLDISPL